MKTSPRRNPQSALAALSDAHQLAMAPFAFQTAASLKDFGILKALDEKGADGLTPVALAQTLGLDDYTRDTLMIAGEAFGLLETVEDRVRLTKMAYFFVNDPLVQVNFDFSRDVCYEGLAALTDSFKEGKPVGLKVFGEWPTIYPKLQSLPEPARTSWFAFDHYYSDEAYAAALPYVFDRPVRALCDVGGNTGKFSRAATDYNDTVKVTIVDLPEQCETAQANAKAMGREDRINTFPIDWLSDAVPAKRDDADVWWMSQFLDCFSPAQIISILKRVREAMHDDARLLVLEPLVGRQPFEAGEACVAAYSLYFTAMANGTSRFYRYEDFLAFFEAAGFVVDATHDGLGVGHTLMVCKKA